MKVTNTYHFVPRSEWKDFHEETIPMIPEEKLLSLTSLNDKLSYKDVREVYVPLVEMIDLYQKSSKALNCVKSKFINHTFEPSPFIIGVSGSVAVGKSTTARVLQKLLQNFYPEKNISLVTTDGFLYPNAILKEKVGLDRKGFPESYDMEQLIKFLLDVKSGQKNVRIPVYSHRIYDIVDNEFEEVNQPDILIVEGINVLQLPTNQTIYVSDFFDFSIYVDAEVENIEQWYLERFEMLMELAKDQPDNYYHNYAVGDRDAAITMAKSVWKTVNLKNLTQFIAPTKTRADLIIHKSDSHYVDYIKIKKY